MALCTQLLLMVQSGYAAINARKHTMSVVSAQISQNQQNGFFCAAFLSANSKWVELDQPKWVIVKQLTISVFTVPKQKHSKKKYLGKDGHVIGPRRDVSVDFRVKEQQWTEADIHKAFNMWDANKNPPTTPTKEDQTDLS